MLKELVSGVNITCGPQLQSRNSTDEKTLSKKP